MAPLARKAVHVEQIGIADLPHLEEYIRKEGANHDIITEKDHIALGDEPVRITRWMLVRSLWAGQAFRILSGKSSSEETELLVLTIVLFVETLVSLTAFVQIWAMHEVISSIDENEDVAYTRLMCWMIFTGQALASLLSAYSWSRENYLIHVPVRMSLSSLVSHANPSESS